MQQIYKRTPMPKCDCRNVISIKLQSNFIEITLHGCSPVNLLHIFRTPFTKNTSGWLPLSRYLNCTELKSLSGHNPRRHKTSFQRRYDVVSTLKRPCVSTRNDTQKSMLPMNNKKKIQTLIL